MDALRKLNSVASLSTPPLFEVLDTDDLFNWKLAWSFDGRDESCFPTVLQRFPPGTRVVLEVRFGEPDADVAPPRVRVAAPIVEGPSLFSGVVCANDVAQGEWRLAAAVDVVCAVRTHLAQTCRVVKPGEYTEDELSDGARYIATLHPDWKLQSDTDPETIRQATELHDQAQELAARARLGSKSDATTHLADARRVASQAVDLVRSAQFLSTRGALSADMGDWAAAHSDFAEARRRGASPGCCYAMANASFQLGELDRALGELVQAMPVAPGPFQGLVRSVALAIGSREFQKLKRGHLDPPDVGASRVTLLQAQELDPACAGISLALAASFDNTGDVQTADALHQRVVDSGHDATGHVAVVLRGPWPDEAGVQWAAAIERGRRMFQARRFFEAILEFDDARALSPPREKHMLCEHVDALMNLQLVREVAEFGPIPPFGSVRDGGRRTTLPHQIDTLLPHAAVWPIRGEHFGVAIGEVSRDFAVTGAAWRLALRHFPPHVRRAYHIRVRRMAVQRLLGDMGPLLAQLQQDVSAAQLKAKAWPLEDPFAFQAQRQRRFEELVEQLHSRSRWCAASQSGVARAAVFPDMLLMLRDSFRSTGSAEHVARLNAMLQLLMVHTRSSNCGGQCMMCKLRPVAFPGA